MWWFTTNFSNSTLVEAGQPRLSSVFFQALHMCANVHSGKMYKHIRRKRLALYLQLSDHTLVAERPLEVTIMSSSSPGEMDGSLANLS